MQSFLALQRWMFDAPQATGDMKHFITFTVAESPPILIAYRRGEERQSEVIWV
jgi:hypothetical protein